MNGSLYIIFIIFAISLMSMALIGGDTPSIRHTAPPKAKPTAHVQQETNTFLQQDATVSPSISPSAE